MTNQNNSALSELIGGLEAVAADVRQHFGGLDARQINWKPGPEQWSVGQCLDHLITANRSYFPTFESIISGKHRPRLWERMPALPGMFGKLMIKSLDPATTRKLKAPAIIRPTSSDVDPRIVENFLQHQQEVIGFLRASDKLEVRKIIITSPVLALVTYSLLDAFTIILVHERRHYQQAVRVTEAAGFPARDAAGAALPA